MRYLLKSKSVKSLRQAECIDMPGDNDEQKILPKRTTIAEDRV
jgi:hypothetical protein